MYTYLKKNNKHKKQLKVAKTINIQQKNEKKTTVTSSGEL